MGHDWPMLYTVIPAGGSGTRLWPLSRADHPKFLIPLTGQGGSLLQATRSRLEPLAPAERTYVVTGGAHAAEVARQLPEVPAGNLLVEPSPRDSCAAIGLAAAVIAERDREAVMGSFAADHVIKDGDAFVTAVRQAVDGAREGWLMTIGMKPTRPETGFGYLQCGAEVAGGPVRRVARFKEKPDQALAETFVASGEYLWNASVFVWRVEVFLAELARQQPQLHAGLVRIAAAWDSPQREAVLGEVWPELPRIAVDYAVMEGAAADGKVATVPGDFGWGDVGDFGNIGELLPADDHGNVVLGDVLVADASGSVLVSTAGRQVAALGLRDVVVVDTPDALLICALDRAQDVKQIVEEVRRRGGPT
jgi:mannose-1-phosphate guanylyltransferase